LLSCASCGRPLRIPATALGKRIRCPLCSDTFLAQPPESPGREGIALTPGPEQAVPPVEALEPEPEQAAPIVDERVSTDPVAPAPPEAPVLLELAEEEPEEILEVLPLTPARDPAA